MANITKQKLSASIDGKSIPVVATATIGTLVHATTVSDTTIDEVWIYATNVSGADEVLTLEFGGVGVENSIILTIPSKEGLSIAVSGLILTGTGVAANNITAFASVASAINITGYINRITP